MNLAIQFKTALLDGNDLLKCRSSDHFLSIFAPPSRHREIPMHPSGTRVAMVWDQLGLVAYEDRPEGLMSHFILAFDPKETPEHPAYTKPHTIEINGSIVTRKTSETNLTKTGPTPITMAPGKHFFYKTDNYSVHFTFKRTPNLCDRDVLTQQLISVEFSWRNPSVPSPK